MCEPYAGLYTLYTHIYLKDVFSEMCVSILPSLSLSLSLSARFKPQSIRLAVMDFKAQCFYSYSSITLLPPKLSKPLLMCNTAFIRNVMYENFDVWQTIGYVTIKYMDPPDCVFF